MNDFRLPEWKFATISTETLHEMAVEIENELERRKKLERKLLIEEINDKLCELYASFSDGKVPAIDIVSAGTGEVFATLPEGFGDSSTRWDYPELSIQ